MHAAPELRVPAQILLLLHVALPISGLISGSVPAWLHWWGWMETMGHEARPNRDVASSREGLVANCSMREQWFRGHNVKVRMINVCDFSGMLERINQDGMGRRA